MLDPATLAAAFNQGVGYEKYLAAAKEREQTNWNAFHERVQLTEGQIELIRGIARRINVLCVSGSWCGDCVQQVPIVAKIAAALPAGASPAAAGIDLRMLDRDEHADFADRVRICGGLRVPVVLFLNEDFDFVALAGDRTISRYRAIARRSLGPSCPLPGAPVPADEIAATAADWVAEFERVALLLRLSPKLRSRHGD
jgi:hypothetical protein